MTSCSGDAKGDIGESLEGLTQEFKLQKPRTGKEAILSFFRRKSEEKEEEKKERNKEGRDKTKRREGRKKGRTESVVRTLQDQLI